MTLGADSPAWDEYDAQLVAEPEVVKAPAHEVQYTTVRVVSSRKRPPLVFDATEAEIAEAVEDSRYLHRGPWTQQAPSGELAWREVE